MKLQLKRSNVLSKAPTAGQMEYGELAVNYNEADPAIYMKDTNNNVIRISGVGNISDDGLTEVPSDNVAPPNPVSGNLWFNADEGRLYIYYIDENSEQWVDASPDNWSASVLPDITDPSEQPGSLDDRYVSKVATTSQDMAGNLTLGTNKITLNAADGSASFSGDIEVASKVHVNNDAGGNVYLLTSENEGERGRVYITSDGVSAQDQPALHIGVIGQGDKIKLNHNGSASFSGDVEAGVFFHNQPSGNLLLSAFVAQLDSGDRFRVRADGEITISDANLGNPGSIRFIVESNGHLALGNDVTVNPAIDLKPDGSASFAGAVGFAGAAAGRAYETNESASITDTGRYIVRNDSNNFNVFEVYKGNNSNVTLSLTSDGSATFASTVTANNASVDKPCFVASVNNASAQANAGGLLIDINQYSGNTTYAIKGQRSNGTETFKITADGSASFSSRITAGGYALAQLPALPA